MSLEKLKVDANAAATWRGHRLGRWEDHRQSVDRQTAIAVCRCGEYVQVDTRPPANGIDIGGPAVAINCKMERAE